MASSEKIIVTGSSSFIGYHLALNLHQSNKDVVITGSRGLGDYNGIQFKRINSLIGKKIVYEQLDITNNKNVKKLIYKHSPTTWFHLPAWTKDWGSYDFDLTNAFKLNVIPLKFIIKYLKESGCQGFIHVGSEAEYGQENDCKDEKDRCFPLMPYGYAKLMQTIRIKQLAYQYEMPSRVGRVFSPFGIYENPLKLLSQVLNALKNDTPIELSSCQQQRDFIFTDDLVDGFNRLGHYCNKDKMFDIFNISSGVPTKLKTLLIELVSILDGNLELLKFGEKSIRKGEQSILYGNNNKAKSLLDWDPGNPISKLSEFANRLKK